MRRTRHSGAPRSGEPGIHNHHREYGFRLSRFALGRNDKSRREFIAALGGAAASSISWPLAARAQERVRRVAMVAGIDASDPDAQNRTTTFLQAMQQLGWIDGRNLRVDYFWGQGQPAMMRKHAADLAALAPDAILVSGTAPLGPLLQATRTVPIVFVNVADPVGGDYVESMSRPGGNATGFIQFEYSLAGKWLELLKQIAPDVTRAAVLRDAALSSGVGQFAVIQSVAPSVGVEVSPINVRDPGEIERAIAAFARPALASGASGQRGDSTVRPSNRGLIVTSSALTARHREHIIALAARHRLPAVYYRRLFVADGGLVSYGYDLIDQYRRAAGYVDRILKGEKPADLPVQAPVKYEITINLKTAKAIGLDVPPSVLARADEVIE